MMLLKVLVGWNEGDALVVVTLENVHELSMGSNLHSVLSVDWIVKRLKTITNSLNKFPMLRSYYCEEKQKTPRIYTLQL